VQAAEKLQLIQALATVARVEMVYQVEAVPVVRGEMVVPVQVLRAAHKIQAQASHQIFQVHRWNMAVVEMEIMVALQELPEMVQEVWILFH
jgi:hypothetical protein